MGKEERERSIDLFFGGGGGNVLKKRRGNLDT